MNMKPKHSVYIECFIMTFSGVLVEYGGNPQNPSWEDLKFPLQMRLLATGEDAAVVESTVSSVMKMNYKDPPKGGRKNKRSAIKMPYESRSDGIVVHCKSRSKNVSEHGYISVPIDFVTIPIGSRVGVEVDVDYYEVSHSKGVTLKIRSFQMLECP